MRPKLRSAYFSVKLNMPLLWTFYDRPELGLPNTNNVGSAAKWVRKFVFSLGGLRIQEARWKNFLLRPDHHRLCISICRSG